MFGWLKSGRTRSDAPLRDVAALASHLTEPGALLVPVDAPAKSHLGGGPNLPPGVPWPTHKGQPLGFLARISLPELHATRRIDWLPADGALLFFYDVDNQPWGFDPKDRGSWQVLHVRDLTDPGSDGEVDRERCSFPRANVAFRAVTTYPSLDRPQVEALALTKGETDVYWALMDSEVGDAPGHQVGGFPAPIQNDSMELDAQLASNGVYVGDAAWTKDPAVAALEAGAADWALLFQLNSDDDLGLMWGDLGTLFFWVRRQDAAAGNFSDTWVVLQCH